MPAPFSFEPIGYVESPYREKFGAPRQAGLVHSARGKVNILPAYAGPEAFSGLETASHIWLIFVFHAIATGQWRPTVRPPRLGGNKRIGVFATRSGFRPNPIGMSVVRLEAVNIDGNQVSLDISGVDLVDGTPVLDIKPYIPYADSIAEANNGLAPTAPQQLLSVSFSAQADLYLSTKNPLLRELIVETLSLDPRPAYKGNGVDDRVYGMQLEDTDVRWRVGEDGVVLVEEVTGR